MKKYVTKIAVLTAIIMSVAFSASAQIYVKIRPKVPVVVKSEPPAQDRVWIDEEWRVRNGRYEYNGGRWVAPPRSNAVWVPGHWKRNGRHGERWVPGHWKY